MKKNLIYLFSVLCMLSMMASCSDEEGQNPDVPEVAGTWAVDMTNPLYANIDLGNPKLNAVIASKLKGLPARIQEDFSDITAEFGEDNKYSIRWTPKESGKEMFLPEFMALDYVQEGETLFFLLDKPSVDFGMKILKTFGYDGAVLSQIKGLLLEKNDKYALPVLMKDNGGKRAFFCSKEIMAPLIAAYLQLKMGKFPAEQKPMMEALLKALPHAKSLDMGFVMMRATTK